MNACAMIRRNPDHVCASPLKAFHVKRLIDNMEGTLTVCESEMKRLEEVGFKVLPRNK